MLSKFPGNVRDCFRKDSGTCPRKIRKQSGNKSSTFPENISDNFRKVPGQNPATFLVFLKNSRKVSGRYPENIHTISGQFPRRIRNTFPLIFSEKKKEKDSEKYGRLVVLRRVIFVEIQLHGVELRQKCLDSFRKKSVKFLDSFLNICGFSGKVHEHF